MIWLATQLAPTMATSEEFSEFYFDDQGWAIRYVVVDTGGWLSGRRVLILTGRI